MCMYKCLKLFTMFVYINVLVIYSHTHTYLLLQGYLPDELGPMFL